MAKKSKTHSFTSRKKSFGNYWLVYSNKTGEILKLVSDREVAHWALNLEFNPSVQSFKFDDFSSTVLVNETLLDVEYRALVRCFDGLEYHHISVSKNEANGVREQLIDSALWRNKHIKFRHISDYDFIPKRHHIFPLLRLSAFLTSNKDQYVSPGLIESVDAYLRRIHRGTLAKCLTDLRDFSRPVLMLYLYRLYNEGAIDLNFEETPFMYSTKWELTHE
jgi:hypothetical protein